MSTQQQILSELKFFINGLSSAHRGGVPPEVGAQFIKTSLNLLETLPATREVILEYFAMVFDTSVGNYVKFVEKDPQGTAPEDDKISDIQEALENLVTKGPPAWAPLISSWSLRNLGALSNKYSRGRAMDIGSSCTLWLGSNAMRCLLGLAASCFGKMNSTDTEECISTLLSTFVQNSPHFDWVVARLGGCFPLKVISKILQCGLKGFVGNFNSTLDSEVGILGYLSFAHEIDLKFALKEMFQNVLYQNVTSSQPHVNTIPYLLHLCTMSEILLQPILSVFLEMFNESLIPTLVNQSKMWPPNFNSRDIFPSLSALVMKIKLNATKTVLTIAKIAEKYFWCQEFLETVLQELESIVWEDRTCSLLNDLLKDESKVLLWKACNSEHLFEQQTAVRLLLVVAFQVSYVYNQSIAELLSNGYEIKNHGLGSLIRLLSGPHGTTDYLPIKPGIDLALEKIFLRKLKKRPEETVKDYNTLKNLLTILKLEKQNNSMHLKQMSVTTTGRECASKILKVFDGFFQTGIDLVKVSNMTNNTETEIKTKKLKTKSEEGIDQEVDVDQLYKDQIHVIAQMLDVLEVGGVECILDMTDVIRLAKLTVKYFFWSLSEKDHVTRLSAINRSFSMLSRQCCVRKASRTIALRELLEGTLFYYGSLFNRSKERVNVESSNESNELLMKVNQKHGNILSATRSILHAGIIGNGLRQEEKDDDVEIDEELQSKFLGAITACCKSEDTPTTIDGFSTVSLLLVEMVSSDVMYNGLPWPDEDVFTKVTMERDLQIRRTFKTTPILWSILGLVAAYRPAICFASVLLRALCASVLHQWRAKSVDKYQTPADNKELYDVTRKTLEILAMGQLLPPPLNYIHIVIEYLDPPEIVVVLKECVWNYLKENVPSPVLYGVDSSGLHWRDSVAAKPYPQFVDPLRTIMQRKLSKLGNLYHQMFVLSELSENVSKES